MRTTRQKITLVLVGVIIVLIYGAYMQMLWNTIIDQNKKILENQNIQMCLEVIKSQYNWDEIAKYLTERGVNCIGLEIR